MATGKIDAVVKFVNGATVILTGGNNIGRIGILQSVEHHPGSFEIAHVKDSNGHSFSTRLQNVTVIGDGTTPAISLPKEAGIKLTLIEERDKRQGDLEEESDEDEE